MNIQNLHLYGVSDISYKEMQTTEGGAVSSYRTSGSSISRLSMGPVWWLIAGIAAGAIFGGIEDFNAGYKAAKK